MSAVVIAAFVHLPPAAGFAEPEAARIVVFHVPCAMVAVLAYVVSVAYALLYLARRHESLDSKSAVSAGLGFLFTVLATVTGMVFAQVQWGSAWNWDPRETSVLMLMFVYAAYFALRASLPFGPLRGRICAAYNILAAVVMPYLVFILPRLLGGLHPTTTLTRQGSLSAEYRIVLFASGVAMALIYLWVFRIHVRIDEYHRERSKRLRRSR